MVGLSAGPDRGFREYWPFLAGGLLSPVMASVLTRWVPLHCAVAGSSFVAWFAAISLFQRGSARAGTGLVGKLAVSAVAGLVGGVLAFLLPWK